jgi:type IV secretory pathway TrbF-like protein
MTRRPTVAIDYVNAQLVLAQHVARARSQAAQWRRIGIAAASLCLCLGLTVAVTARSHVVAHVVETPTGGVAMHSGERETAQTGPTITQPQRCTVAGIVIAALPSGITTSAACENAAAARPLHAEFRPAIYTEGQ